jgi:hypothetical protein
MVLPGRRIAHPPHFRVVRRIDSWAVEGLRGCDESEPLGSYQRAPRAHTFRGSRPRSIDERIEMAQVASLTARIAELEKWSCRPRHVYRFEIANGASRRRVELERVGYIRSARIESSRTHDTIG